MKIRKKDSKGESTITKMKVSFTKKKVLYFQRKHYILEQVL